MALFSILGAALPILSGLFSKGKDKPNILGTLLGATGAGLSAAGGGGYSPEETEAARYKYAKKEAEDRLSRAKAEGLKPTTPRHEYWSGLSQIAPFLQNAVMGSFRDIFGEDTLGKWGSSYTPAAGGQAPAPTALGPGGGGGMPGGGEPGRRERPYPPWRRGGGGYREI